MEQTIAALLRLLHDLFNKEASRQDSKILGFMLKICTFCIFWLDTSLNKYSNFTLPGITGNFNLV